MTDLTYLQKSDKELDSLRWQANKAGAQARKKSKEEKQSVSLMVLWLQKLMSPLNLVIDNSGKTL